MMINMLSDPEAYYDLIHNPIMKKIFGNEPFFKYDYNTFKNFIDKDMRLDPVLLHKEFDIQSTLSFYMGENTLERREFIMSNLRIEDDESIVVA